MAMSLKKIGAIAVGGAMVASALASGAMAATTTSGDVAGFMKNVVKDGQPNVDIVVGSNAAAMDVVSAADIAAKIGSMAYKTVPVEDGKVKVLATSQDETNSVPYHLNATNCTTMFAIPNSDYNDLNNISVGCSSCGSNEVITSNAKCGDNELSTLMVVKDVDPDDLICDFDADGIEVLFANMSDDNGCDKAKVVTTGYASFVTQDGKLNVSGMYLAPAMFIPFLGEEYMVVDIDTDDDAIYIGKPIYKGEVDEGKSVSLGNGYEVKVVKLQYSSDDKLMATIQLLKDGKVVDEDTDVVSAPCCSCPGETCNNQITLTDGHVGVIAVNSYTNLAQTEGSVKIYAADNIKKLELGEDYNSKFKIYGVVVNNNSNTSIEIPSATSITKVTKSKQIGKVNYTYTEYQINNEPLIGIALVREDDTGDMGDGSSVKFLDGYYEISAEDGGSNILNFKFAMDVKKKLELSVGDTGKTMNTDIKLLSIEADAEKVTPIKAPIAKLDSEVSLDSADKNLILVGGPVVNALTKALVDDGKIAINNSSPATLAVVEGAANGNDVLVVAGGDREKTREAALDLIENY